MDMKDFGTKLQAILEAEQPGSPVLMHFVLAFGENGSRIISQKPGEHLVEELKRFLKEVERTY